MTGMKRTIGPIERRLRTRHRVRDDGSTLVFLGMDAHMDWDWLNTFQDLVVTGNSGAASAQALLEAAWQLMVQSAGQTPYPYAVCEMGFLRAVLQREPGLVAQFREYNLSQQLSIEGGGLTSPDNLLSHGEAFIRTYLLGQGWL